MARARDGKQDEGCRGPGMGALESRMEVSFFSACIP